MLRPVARSFGWTATRIGNGVQSRPRVFPRTCGLVDDGVWNVALNSASRSVTTQMTRHRDGGCDAESGVVLVAREVPSRWGAPRTGKPRTWLATHAVRALHTPRAATATTDATPVHLHPALRHVSTHTRHTNVNVARLTRRLPLVHGGALPEITLRWEQWGDTSLPPDRTIYVMPSFSHGAHVASHRDDPSPGWWEGFVGPGRFLDTNHFRIISAAPLGGPYGSTSPLSLVPEAGFDPEDLPVHTIGGEDAPPITLLQRTATGPNGRVISTYGPRFPVITPADQARAHAYLLDHLGLPSVHAVIGGSMGGMQVLQFGALFPERVSRLVAISTTGRTTPTSVAFRRIQRQAIVTDPAYEAGFYDPKHPPMRGLRLARELGMICYRSREEFDTRFDWAPTGPLGAAQASFEMEQYMQYQGQKFSSRFDANCYLTLSKSMDLMDLSDEDSSFVEGVRRVKANTLLLGVKQDALTPPSELRAVMRILKEAQLEEEEVRARLRGGPSVTALAAPLPWEVLSPATEPAGQTKSVYVAPRTPFVLGAAPPHSRDTQPSTSTTSAPPASAAAAGTSVLGVEVSGPVLGEANAPLLAGSEGADEEHADTTTSGGSGHDNAQPSSSEGHDAKSAVSARWHAIEHADELSEQEVGRKRCCAYLELDSPYGHDAMFHHDMFEWFGSRAKAHIEAGLEAQLQEERVHTTGLSLP